MEPDFDDTDGLEIRFKFWTNLVYPQYQGVLKIPRFMLVRKTVWNAIRRWYDKR